MKDWLPEEIVKFRRSYKLTRRALGELIGATVSTIYKWERGLRTPNKITKTLLSKVEKELRQKRKEVIKRG